MRRNLIPAPALTLAAAGAAAMLAVAASGPATAHHSFAMFDSSETRELEGEVARFQWANPHVSLFVREGGSQAQADLWSVELTSPGNLQRLGWTRGTLRPGDRVMVEMNPLRDGRQGGGFVAVTFLDTGERLTASLIDIERNR